MPSNLLRGSRALNANPIWLITGKGDMLDRAPSTDDQAYKVTLLDEGQRKAVMAVVECLLQKE